MLINVYQCLSCLVILESDSVLSQFEPFHRTFLTRILMLSQGTVNLTGSPMHPMMRCFEEQKRRSSKTELFAALPVPRVERM
jgi:hypothetical protein